MRTYEKCLKCFERQTADACDMAGISPNERERVMRKVRDKIQSFPLDHPPVEMARDIHLVMRSAAGVEDPYADIKRKSNLACQACLPLLRQKMRDSADHFEAGLKLAIIGNMIDFGAYAASKIDLEDIANIIEDAFEIPLTGDGVDAFRDMVADAKRILYIGDNAGECFFDHFLLEQLPHEKLTYAVRGRAVLNDATRQDAELAGIHNICRVISTGDCTPGVMLKYSSPIFRSTFQSSDLIIAKGQGNYESLSGRSDKTYAFLTKVKCDVIARDIGFAAGSSVVKISYPESSVVSKETVAG